MRIFSSASDAPLARRPTDAVLLVLSIVAIVALSFIAPGPTAIDTALTEVVKLLPGLAGWFWEISYTLLIGWAIILLVLALLAHGRKRLFLEELFAAAIALGFALTAGKVAGTDWPSSLKAILSTGSPPVYLAVRLAIATAVVVMASPHMTRPLRHVGRWVIGIGAFAGVAIGVTLPIGLVAGFVIGIGSAAIVHLLLGSPAGRLTLDQIAAALADLGVDAVDLRNAALEPRGVALAVGSTPDGRSLLAKVYGRDARDGQFLSSLWRSVWNRGETPHLGMGRLQQVEHEAFVTLFAERGGVPVLPVVAAGMTVEHDALLVIESTGRTFVSLDADEVDDRLVGELWSAVRRLHDLGMAHGRLDGYRLVLRPSGTVAIGDFGEAKMAAAASDIMADQAQLLVTTALAVGHERAVSAVAAALGTDGLANTLPFLQPAVFDRATRRAMHDKGWDLDDLRALAAKTGGIEPPDLEKIRRVTPRSIVLVALIGVFAYYLISSLAGVDLQSIVDEIKGANSVWLWTALLMSPFIQAAEAFSTVGASIQPVRYGPVLMLEYAIQFIALAVPSSAARVALEVRFFERNGVDAGGAIMIGLIDSICGFVIQALLIVLITVSGLASLNLGSARSSSASSSSSSGSSSSVPIWLLLVGLLVLGAIIALAIPKYRAVIKRTVVRYRAALRAHVHAGASALRVLRTPSKLGLIFAGNLSAQILQAIILGICLLAFGQHASLAGLILVNTAVSLFAGFMPVPGGMGVAEAGYTAGLEALGISSSVAVSTAIAFRLVTFYLPPIWGSYGMRWLRRHSYV